MISIVCFKWRGPKEFKTQFTPGYVHILYDMVKRHYHAPFNFFCVTDQVRETIDEVPKAVRVMPLWNMPSVEKANPKRPNCYKRLKLFDKESEKLFGPRVVALDLDIIVTGDVTDIFNTPGDFVGYNKGGVPYQGAFFIHQIGTRPRVWEEFDPETSPVLAKRYPGSDQAWLSHILPKGEKVLTKADGLYCFDIDRLNRRQPPKDCKIVFFRGNPKPWYTQVYGRVGWVSQHWRLGP